VKILVVQDWKIAEMQQWAGDSLQYRIMVMIIY